MQEKPSKQHEWLNQLVGDWTIESEMSMGPDQPPMKHTGSENVRLLGGIWAVCEGGFDMPGGARGTNIMTLGYDPAKNRYVGTFISSMMSYLWHYDNGEVGAGGKVLTLDAEGPGMTPDVKLAKYKDTIEIVSPDERILRSQMLQSDGTWFPFMSAHYRRKK